MNYVEVTDRHGYLLHVTFLDRLEQFVASRRCLTYRRHFAERHR